VPRENLDTGLNDWFLNWSGTTVWTTSAIRARVLALCLLCVAQEARMDDDRNTRDADDEPVRQGDILGLGGAAVPKAPEDTNTSFERSGERGSESIGEDEHDDRSRRDSAYRHGSGATGIDMGSGGSGTDVE
jgi:hypothetical protein